MDDESFGHVLDVVRHFVREQVMPREQEIEDTDAIPDDLRRAAADLGLFGYALPAEFGGLGAQTFAEIDISGTPIGDVDCEGHAAGTLPGSSKKRVDPANGSGFDHVGGLVDLA